MSDDLKEQEGLHQIDTLFHDEVKRSVANVVSDNPGLNEGELRKKILAIIEKYFDQSIGIEKMGVMLSTRGCITDPIRFLEMSKQKYLMYYTTCQLPLVNSKTTLQQIAAIAKDLDKKIEEALKDKPKSLGFIHLYWATKKKILMDDYGIIWFSPAECNPDMLYD